MVVISLLPFVSGSLYRPSLMNAGGRGGKPNSGDRRLEKRDGRHVRRGERNGPACRGHGRRGL